MKREYKFFHTCIALYSFVRNSQQVVSGWLLNSKTITGPFAVSLRAANVQLIILYAACVIAYFA